MDDVKMQNESRSNWCVASYGSGLARINELVFNRSVQALVTLAAYNDNSQDIIKLCSINYASYFLWSKMYKKMDNFFKNFLLPFWKLSWKNA